MSPSSAVPGGHFDTNYVPFELTVPLALAGERTFVVQLEPARIRELPPRCGPSAMGADEPALNPITGDRN